METLEMMPERVSYGRCAGIWNHTVYYVYFPS